MDAITKFQIRSLQDEIVHLRHSLDFVPAPVYLACVHFRRFRWTLSRLLGLEGRPSAAGAAIGDFSAGDFPAAPLAALAAPRVFLDATDSAAATETTGVRRVVRELCRAAAQDRSAAPVRIAHGRFVALDGGAIDFRSGDSLVLLDAGWLRTPDYVAAVTAARAAGCAIVLGLYDLIPLNQPGFTPPAFSAAFDAWIRALAPLSDAVVAISRAVAEDFIAFRGKMGNEFAGAVKVGWFSLGADLAAPAGVAPSSSTRAALARSPRYFLSVGTLEPRKGHAVALDAFDIYGRAGGQASYIIVGKRGFASDALVERIETHAEYGRRLFWLSNAGDGDLAALYGAAIALVLPSIAEGFGLPVIEAAHFGTPVIASDIPVLREVGESRIDYFRALDAGDLADRLAVAVAVADDDGKRAPPRLTALNWRQATAALTNMVANRTYQMAIEGGVR
ncbi:MAG: glycosyltransferase family 4 protein [Rhodoblastus sp.]